VNSKGETYGITQADVPNIKLFNIQTAMRLANAIRDPNWCAGNKNTEEWAGTVQIWK